MRAWTWGAGLAAVVAVAVVLMNWQGIGSSEASEGRTGMPETSAHNALPVQTKISPKAPSAPTEVTLSMQIRDLVTTGDPEKLFDAYNLLADCDEFNREHDRMVQDEKGPTVENIFGYRHMTDQEKQQEVRRCGAMTERERQSRMDYLSIAVKAGVAGTAVAFLREGPFGDHSALTTRPNDPLVQEWKALARAYLTSEAEMGIDLGAINYLASEEMVGSDVFEKNVRLAYRYYIANGLIESVVVGPNSDIAKFYAEDSQLLKSVGAELSPAERAVEVAAAQQIARNFLDRRKATKAISAHG